MKANNSLDEDCFLLMKGADFVLYSFLGILESLEVADLLNQFIERTEFLVGSYLRDDYC